MARGKKKESLTPEERLQAALVPESEQPYPVPWNWCWTRMENIAQWGSGGTPSRKIPEYYSGDIPWIKTGELNDDYIFETEEHITEEAISHSSAKLFPVNTVAIAMYGATIGKVGILGIAATTNQACACGVSNPSANYKYLFYYARSQKDNFIKKGKGGAQPNISQEIIKSHEFPLPPLSEQHRIVDRIESLFAKLDEAKQKAQDALDSFETRKAAILHKAFTGELIGKHSTATTTLEEITTCIRIGPFGSALHKEDYILGGVPVVNPKHIVQQKIVPEEKTTVSVLKAEELSSYILQKNDIILGRRGDMGRSAPVTDLETGWLCGTGSMIIRLKSGYNAKFYSQIIASQAAVRYLEENSVGSTMKNLNEKVVRLLPIPDFTVDEQLEIVRILDNLLAKEQQAKEVAEKVLEQIDLIKKAILARAFRGELGTNDPSEENAKELLSSEI